MTLGGLKNQLVLLRIARGTLPEGLYLLLDIYVIKK